MVLRFGELDFRCSGFFRFVFGLGQSRASSSLIFFIYSKSTLTYFFLFKFETKIEQKMVPKEVFGGLRNDDDDD